MSDVSGPDEPTAPEPVADDWPDFDPGESPIDLLSNETRIIEHTKKDGRHRSDDD